MAWRRRFRYIRRKAWNNYRFSRFSRRGGFGNKWVTFVAGVAAGYLTPDVVPYQNELALVATAAPVKMPRVIRSVASGYVIGRIIQIGRASCRERVYVLV